MKPDICPYCNGKRIRTPRKFTYGCKWCNSTGKAPLYIASKEKRMTQKQIRSILDLKQPHSVLSIEYHIYPEQIHGVAKIRGAQEPFVMYMRTKHFDWAMRKFNAALTKHRWTSSNKETTLKAFYYADIYNEMRKQTPYKIEEL